jgi:glycosyltransferase involved in cell wall biosynthesis
MRVLILGDASVPHIHKWADILRELGNEVNVITFEESLDDKVLRLKLPGGKFKYLLGIPKLKGLIKELKPDVLFPHFIPNYGLIAYFLKGFKVLAVWGSDINVWAKKTAIHNFLAKIILKKFDILVCDAGIIKRTLVEDFGIREDRIFVIPFGVEREIRERPLKELPFDEIRILSFRRHEENFNHFEVLRFAKMLSQSFKIRLIYINGGRLTEKLEKTAREMGLNFENLGKVPRERYINLLESSHFCVSIPKFDGTSVSLLEGMALGCVPIVSDIPPNREWVDENRGIISEPKGEKLFESFIRVFSWDWWRKARVENKRVILQRCKWEENVKRFWDLVSKESLSGKNQL